MVKEIKYIAIKHNEVVAEAESMQEITRKAEELSEEGSGIYIFQRIKLVRGKI